MPLVDAFTACEVYRRARDGESAPSLAAISPADVDGMDFQPGGDWTEDQKAKLRKQLAQETLFGSPVQDKSILSKPRMEGFYRYRCLERNCKGHRQGMLDWEFTQLQRHHAEDSAPAALDALRKRFVDELCDATRGLVFFLGNQAKRARLQRAGYLSDPGLIRQGGAVPPAS